MPRFIQKHPLLFLTLATALCFSDSAMACVEWAAAPLPVVEPFASGKKVPFEIKYAEHDDRGGYVVVNDVVFSDYTLHAGERIPEVYEPTSDSGFFYLKDNKTLLWYDTSHPSSAYFEVDLTFSQSKDAMNKGFFSILFEKPPVQTGKDGAVLTARLTKVVPNPSLPKNDSMDCAQK